ncbi:MAG: glycosyltransferase family 39 protein [Anaerolineae bacterium]|nr:glycosyltransferase family 39 protein [Anaerolineae bacterium]
MIDRFFRHKNIPWLWLILAVALFVRLYRLSSAPPGISGDEMFNAVDAAQINWRNLPVYFEGNNGREALFFYLMALSTWLLGPTIFALRLPAALLGVGSVLLAYGLGRDAFHRHVGLLAAGLTAVSLWPIMESRWALRAVSLTFCTTLTVFLMMRGWQNGRRRDWLLGGVALGLTMYTYIPSRVFPAVILIWLVWLWWFDSPRLRQQWQNIALSLLMALLVFVPYGLYMQQNPEKVNQRISGLTVALEDALEDGQWDALGQSITATLKTFTWQGDTDWRYHLSGQPIFDPITGLFFYSGFALCLWFAFKRDGRPESASPVESASAPSTQPNYALVLIWLAAMLGPNLIIDDKPSFLRAAGAIVPIYLITAVALHTFARQLSHKWPRLTPIMPVVAVIAFSLILVRSWHDYFDVWRSNPEVRHIYQAELVQISQYLEQNPPPPETRLFIGRSYAHDGAPQTWKYYSDRSINWFVPEQSFPTVPGNTWFFVLDEEPAVPELFAQLPLQTTATITYPDGQPVATLYKGVGPGERVVEQTAVNLRFQQAPTLIGYDLPDDLYRGDSLTLITTWQIPPELPRLPNQLIFIQLELEDENGNIWAKADSILGYPQASWQPHDTFIQLLTLDIPEGMLPGNSYLRFTLHDGRGNIYGRLNDNDTAGRLGPHLIRSRPLANFQLPPDILLFDDTLALQSADFSTLLAPGLPLNIALNWVAIQQPTADYQIEFQLWLPDAAEPYLTQQSAIWADLYPSSQWQANEQVSSFHHFIIPLDIPTTAAPELRLQLLTPTGNPAPITQGDNTLAEMTLSLRDHLFEPPPISQPLTAEFGDSIQLLGYDVDTSRATSHGEIHLTLYWQAVTTPPDHYTVFNHVTGADGQIVGQFDGPPSGDAWLTGAWLPGEVVIDQRTIHLHPNLAGGSYNLLVGLYKASDGQRLPVSLAGQRQENDQLVLTAVTIPPTP